MTENNFILDLIEYANTATPFTFRYITYWEEYRFYRRKLKATKLIIQCLQVGSKNIFKTYCCDVSEGSADFNVLLAYNHILKVESFYRKELDTIQKMIDEYDEYLGQGNFWKSFLGEQRRL